MVNISRQNEPSRSHAQAVVPGWTIEDASELALSDLLTAIETLVIHGGDAGGRVADRLQLAIRPTGNGVPFTEALGLAPGARKAARDELLLEIAFEIKREHRCKSERDVAIRVLDALRKVQSNSRARDRIPASKAEAAALTYLSLGRIQTDSSIRQILRRRNGQTWPCKLTRPLDNLDICK